MTGEEEQGEREDEGHGDEERGGKEDEGHGDEERGGKEDEGYGDEGRPGESSGPGAAKGAEEEGEWTVPGGWPYRTSGSPGRVHSPKRSCRRKLV